MNNAKSNELENAILKLLLHNEIVEPLTTLAVVAGGSAALYISLHKADPGEAGDQTTSEVTTGEFVGYTRMQVLRGPTKWTIVNQVGKNAEIITYPTAQPGSTGVTATHIVIGTAASGAGHNLLRGDINGGLGLSIIAGTAPVFPIDAISITEE